MHRSVPPFCRQKRGLLRQNTKKTTVIGSHLQSKGLMSYLLSKPDNWVTTIGDLVKHAVDQEKSVRSGLKELHERGYYKKVPVRDDKGHFVCWQSTVYETSHLEEMH